MHEKWNELLRDAGVMDGRGIAGITVRQIEGMDVEDVVLCPPSDVEGRISALAASRTARRMQPERVFMARAMRHEAETAAALLVRAVIGHWAHSRNRHGIVDAHERRAWDIIQDHLREHGHPVEGDVRAGKQQISDAHIKAPVAHDGPVDVVRKAIAQLVRQMDGRHVIVMGKSPLAV